MAWNIRVSSWQSRLTTSLSFTSLSLWNIITLSLVCLHSTHYLYSHNYCDCCVCVSSCLCMWTQYVKRGPTGWTICVILCVLWVWPPWRLCNSWRKDKSTTAKWHCNILSWVSRVSEADSWHRADGEGLVVRLLWSVVTPQFLPAGHSGITVDSGSTLIWSSIFGWCVCICACVISAECLCNEVAPRPVVMSHGLMWC